MALRRPGVSKDALKTEYPQNFSDFNPTAPGDPSHNVDENTNYFLRPITLENIDEVVYTEFNRRFTVNGKQVNLIMLDADVAAMQHEQFEQFDDVKKYINFPYFTVWRSNVSPLYRSSPSTKPLIYVVPEKKPQGMVYTEYTMPVPRMLLFKYTFQFMTTFRESTNQFETLMLEYFKNKRHILLLDNERFIIGQTDPATLAELDVADREGVNGQTLYILKYELQVQGYLRKLEDIQKRERPNQYSIKIVERSGKQLDSLNQVDNRLPQPSINPPSDPPQPF